MSGIKKEKNGTYTTRFRVAGKSTTKRGFETRLEAEQWVIEQKMRDNYEITPHFQEICIKYLDYIKSHNEFGTYMKAKNFVENIIIPNFNNKRIDCINELDCEQFRNYVSDLNYSTTYKNDILLRFRQIFKYSMKYYRLTIDPSRVCDRFKYSREEKQVLRDRQMQIWTCDDFYKFIRYVDNKSYKALFTTLYFTGMRLGECLALNWNDINESFINIDKSLTRKTNKGEFEIKEPKTVNSVRKVSINKGLYDYLIKYKNLEKLKAGFTDEWYVFGGIKPLPQTTIDNTKERAIRECNSHLPADKQIKRIRIHDLRHSHASYLISNGINIVAVSKRLGHKDITTTLETYTHLIKKNDDELINNIESIFKMYDDSKT